MHPLVTPKRGCTYAPLAKHSRMTMWQNRTDVSTNEVTQLYFEEFSLPTTDMNLTCHSPAVGQGKISWLMNCLAQEKCLAPIVRFAGFAIGHHFFCHFCSRGYNGTWSNLRMFVYGRSVWQAERHKQSPAYQIVYFDGIKHHKKCGLRLCFQRCTHSLWWCLTWNIQSSLSCLSLAVLQIDSPNCIAIWCIMLHLFIDFIRIQPYNVPPPSYVCRFINPMNSIAYYSCKVSLTLVKPELLDVFLQLSFSLAPKMGRFQLVPRQNALRCMEDAGPLIGRSLGA